MIGYVSLYFRVTGKEETYYANINCDFSKPLTEEVFSGLKESVAKAYKNLFPDDEILSVDFCTKEEYENSGQETAARIRFRDNQSIDEHEKKED